jgi:hypothetical protein
MYTNDKEAWVMMRWNLGARSLQTSISFKLNIDTRNSGRLNVSVLGVIGVFDSGREGKKRKEGREERFIFIANFCASVLSTGETWGRCVVFRHDAGGARIMYWWSWCGTCTDTWGIEASRWCVWGEFAALVADESLLALRPSGRWEVSTSVIGKIPSIILKPYAYGVNIVIRTLVGYEGMIHDK